MEKESKKILFLALSGIGNLLMQSPTIAAVKKQRPHWEVTAWIAPRGTRALADNAPYIDRIIEKPIQLSPVQHFAHTFALARERFDIGIVLSPGQLWKSAAYLFLAGIPTRIGHAYPWRSNSASSFLLTHATPELSQTHDIEQNLQLLTLLGIPLPKDPTYKLTIPLRAQEQASSFIAQLNLPRSKRLIGVHPGSAAEFTWKRWPLEHFATVAQELITQHDAHILLFGGPKEEKLKQRLAKEIGQAATPVSTSLLTTAAIMTHCRAIISNDSGLMHVAAASGVTTYGLFGPTDETLTGPRGSNAHALRAPGTTPVYHTETKQKLGTKPHETLWALTPEYVLSHLTIK